MSTRPTITVTVYVSPPASSTDTSKMVDITLVVVLPIVSLILLILVIVVVGYCVKQHRRNKTSAQIKPEACRLTSLPCRSNNNDNDRVVVSVGSSSVVIRKSKMSNIREFMRKIDTILVNVMDKVEDVDGEGGLDQGICENVDQLRNIMRVWVEQPHSPSPQDDYIVTDNSTNHNHGSIACDSPPISKHCSRFGLPDRPRFGLPDRPPSYQDLSCLSDLHYEPQKSINSVVYYMHDEPVPTYSCRRSSTPPSPIDGPVDDVLDLLLPTLAARTNDIRQRSSASH